MTTWNPTQMRDLLLEAGRIALSHFNDPGTTHKADRSLVTVADKAVEAFLMNELAAREQNVFVVGEESSVASTQEAVRNALTYDAYVVDPIDGTSGYANRLPTWGISIGLMRAGTLEDGAVFLPRTGELFVTDGDQVLYEEGSRSPKNWRFTDLRPIQPSRRPYSTMGMISLPQEIVSRARFDGGNPVQTNGSAVYTSANLITGCYLGYISRVRLWDVAAAIPMLIRLGFHLRRETGATIGTQVTDTDWVLDAGQPTCWKSRGLFFAAREEETIRHLLDHYRTNARKNTVQE